TGVKVTTLCPGPTSSNFKDAANMESSRLMNGKKLPTSDEVAAFGYEAMKKGRGVVVHGFVNKFFAFTNRFTPRDWAARVARYLNSAG
ncbi:MAG: short-chain dehydrogenase, partial [Flavobacteriales bacterium]